MKIAKYIDATNLKRGTTRKDIVELINEAKKYQVAGVCVQPGWAYFVKLNLRGTGIKTVYVPNWHMGGGLRKYDMIMLKACKNDSDEVDYVINIYEMYELKRWEKVEEELKLVREHSKVMKVILETAYVHYNHYTELKTLLKQAVQLCHKHKVDWLKTDSGIIKRALFPQKKLSNGKYIYTKPIDTVVEDIKILRSLSKLPIKAAGGIKHLDDALKVIEAGAERIGTSSTRIICEEEQVNKEYQEYKVNKE